MLGMGEFDHYQESSDLEHDEEWEDDEASYEPLTRNSSWQVASVSQSMQLEAGTSTMPVVPDDKVQFIGENAPSWQPVPANWLVFGVHPSFSAKVCTVDAEGKFCTTVVEKVQIWLEETKFRYKY